jgi:O-methyltransferase involved in polyketide biosynthesis
MSFFSWLGVTYYLDRDVVFATLRAIGAVAPAGSPVICDCPANDALVPDKSTRRMQLMPAATQQAREPMKGGLDPATLAADLAGLGLRLRESVSRSTSNNAISTAGRTAITRSSKCILHKQWLVRPRSQRLFLPGKPAPTANSAAADFKVTVRTLARLPCVEYSGPSDFP